MASFQITKVESQVVAGIRYTVHFKLAVTECLKGIETEKLDSCKENTGNASPFTGLFLLCNNK